MTTPTRSRECRQIALTAIQGAAKYFTMDPDDVLQRGYTNTGAEDWLFAPAVAKAAYIMRDNGMLITEIAHQLGMKDQGVTNMRRRVKKWSGERQPDIDPKKPGQVFLLNQEAEFAAARSHAGHILEQLRPGELTRMMRGQQYPTMMQRQAIEVLQYLGLPEPIAPPTQSASANAVYTRTNHDRWNDKRRGRA